MLALALGFLLALSVSAADKDAKKVEVKGTLRTGIAAIGGETTGTIIETKDATFELDLSKDKDLRAKAAKLSDKKVAVTGTLEVRKGVEIKERKIILVTNLNEVKDK